MGTLAGGLGCFPLDDESSHPPSHAPRPRPGIRRLVRVGKREAPSSIQRDTSGTPHAGAAPKCISGRTSYLRVRLAFHRYPQLIRTFCNKSRCGPPQACSARFSLATGRSPGFGSIRDDCAPFRTRVRSGSACPWLNLAAAAHSSAHSTKGTPSQEQLLLRPAGSAWFQDLFHSPRRGAFHRSLTVLVRYRSLAVFSLGAWSPPLQTGYHVSGPTHDPGSPPTHPIGLRDSHPLRCPVPAGFGAGLRVGRGGCRPLHPARPTPHGHRRQAVPPLRFGLLPVRSPLLRESSLFLEVLRCFSSPGAPVRHPPDGPGRAPGGLPHSEISGSPAASASPEHFAAWPRPSSAANAKASTMRSSLRKSGGLPRPHAPARRRPPPDRLAPAGPVSGPHGTRTVRDGRRRRAPRVRNEAGPSSLHHAMA